MEAAIDKLLLIAARRLFRLHQARILNQRSRFSRDGVQNVVADSGNIARSEARVHVQRAHDLGRRPVAGDSVSRVVCTCGLRRGTQITVRRS